jgi:hypothetical protein
MVPNVVNIEFYCLAAVYGDLAVILLGKTKISCSGQDGLYCVRLTINCISKRQENVAGGSIF